MIVVVVVMIVVVVAMVIVAMVWRLCWCLWWRLLWWGGVGGVMLPEVEVEASSLAFGIGIKCRA